jgi:high affinity Mn2+ porin
MLTAFETRARLGLLDEAVQIAQATGNPVDIAATRQLRDRVGADLILEQELAQDLGMFARAGKSSGNVEAYDFTDIDRTVDCSIRDRNRSLDLLFSGDFAADPRES